jgi:hypothetical protein
MDIKSYIWDCWQELWNPDNRIWQYIDRILFPSPAVFNTPTSAKPLCFSGGAKVDIEVSSHDSATCKGEFYIQCHGKYVRR